MSITTITTEDLRRMEGKDGLILQGCGGDLKEWVNTGAYMGHKTKRAKCVMSI